MDVVETSDGKSGGAATLEDHDCWVTPVVDSDILGVWATHFIDGKGAMELEKAVMRILERGLVSGARVHPGSKGPDRDLCPKVNRIANKVGGIDFGGIDLDDREVLSETVLPSAENEGG